MKILILDTTHRKTSLYGRVILDEIFKSHGADIFAIATSKPPAEKKRSYFERMKARYKRQRSFIFVDYLFKLLSLLSGKHLSWKYTEPDTYHDFAAHYPVPVVEFERINSGELRDFIIDNQCDVVYHSGGMILKPIILEAPRIGVVGYHHGDIRKYRGPFQCFWELYNGEKEIGITLQILKPVLDTGPVLLIENYPIPEGIKLKELQRISNWESVRLGAEAIARLKDSSFKPIEDYPLGVYRSYPGFFQVMQLAIKGRI